MNADRVIKSNAEFFNTGTWAGGTWRRNTVLTCGDNVQAAMGSNSVEWNPADTGNCPKPSDPQRGCREVRRRDWVHPGSGAIPPSLGATAWDEE